MLLQLFQSSMNGVYSRVPLAVTMSLHIGFTHFGARVAGFLEHS